MTVAGEKREWGVAAAPAAVSWKMFAQGIVKKSKELWN